MKLLVPLLMVGQVATSTAIPSIPVKESVAIEETIPEKETSNPLAAGLIWGGAAVAIAGVACGLTGHFAYDAKLNDGTIRTRRENQALLDHGRAFDTAGDAALIAGLSAAGIGIVFHLIGIGEF